MPCVALFVLPVGAYFVMQGYSALPNLSHALCMSFGISAPLLRVMGFSAHQWRRNNNTVSNLEKNDDRSALAADTTPPSLGKGRGVRFEDVRFAYK